jgi:DNA-binding CsgD family transcriptional regulator/tetratricopeptide (TPR) repeat protein
VQTIATGLDEPAVTSEEPELLERSVHLSGLANLLGIVRNASTGRLVLVGGEAGAGKTSLLRRFCERERRSARILWGTCDMLSTPRPLGPLFDVAEETGGELAELVTNGAKPHEAAAALTRELGRRSPAILVFEDLHWADEATLDVCRLLARRIENARALALVSYRDDELDRTHPLRLMLGELASDRGVDRLEIPPLSATGVAQLAESHGLDGETLYRKTNGNPFFVSEVLAARTEDIPPSIRDAVLARAMRLSAPARRLLDAVAVAGPRTEIWLLEGLAAEDIGHLEECLASGMLVSGPDSVAFRHELARLTVEEGLAPDRRLALHRKTLDALTERPGSPVDPARLADHAEFAGDPGAALRFAPAAAARAASLGAYREAAAHYAQALRFADGLPAEARAELLERQATAYKLTDQPNEAIEAAQRALECRRELDDRRSEAELLLLLASCLWCPGRLEESRQATLEAVAVLEHLPPGRELAMAYADMCSDRMDAEDTEGALAWGARAIALAERLDEIEPLGRALVYMGVAELLSGDPGGLEKVERALELFEEAGYEERVANGFLNVAWAITRTRSHALASRYIEAGLEYCADRGFDLYRRYLLTFRSILELNESRWSAAAESAATVLREPSGSILLRIFPLTVRGLVRARRGDPEADSCLDEAAALTEASGQRQLQAAGPVDAALAEAAWLRGDHTAVAKATQATLDLAVRRRSPWTIGELACWRRRACIEEDVEGPMAEPYATELDGDFARAAELWRELGCPYDAALALAGADDEELLRLALDELRRLGAEPAAAIVARRLRGRGARGVPRGPRAATRENPAGLTAREVEVLGLVAEGLRNADIAERLFLSEKTVGHHVSAILRKLEVRTRGEAGAEAQRLGLAGQDR